MLSSAYDLAPFLIGFYSVQSNANRIADLSRWTSFHKLSSAPKSTLFFAMKGTAIVQFAPRTFGPTLRIFSSNLLFNFSFRTSLVESTLRNFLSSPDHLRPGASSISPQSPRPSVALNHFDCPTLCISRSQINRPSNFLPNPWKLQFVRTAREAFPGLEIRRVYCPRKNSTAFEMLGDLPTVGSTVR